VKGIAHALNASECCATHTSTGTAAAATVADPSISNLPQLKRLQELSHPLDDLLVAPAVLAATETQAG
jgi:hypothetical protein